LWVLRQRSAYRKGSLARERIERLNNLGFEWRLPKEPGPKFEKDIMAQPRKTLPEIWEEKFIALQQYRDIHGHCNVPQNYPDKPLALWVGTQRTLYNKNSPRLSVEKIKRLGTIGFIWDPLALRWEKMYSAICEFKSINGHCDVPGKNSQNIKLASWTTVQRRNYKKRKLTDSQIQKLESIGFRWEIKNENWNDRYDKISGYLKINEQKGLSRDNSAGNWLSNQRQRYKKGTLPSDSVKQLQQLGIKLDPYSEQWESRYKELCDFVNMHKHANVPSNYSANSSLAAWVNNQRSDYKNKELSAERIEKLNAIGFVWHFLDWKWEKNIAKLIEFKEVYGHCNVPGKFKKDKLLSHFVVGLRENYKKGILSKERIKRLDDLGFIWDVLGEQWKEKYQDLIKFKEVYGHCNVPNDHQELGSWVGNQRNYKKLNKLAAERIQKLETIGFVWSALDNSWNNAFAALCVFKSTRGHTIVPATYVINNLALGSWVRTQRVSYQNNKLTQERFEKLQSISFSW
jgi:hypothetical protein